jgi:hypothetical protein
MSENDKKPARAGKKHWRPEKNGGVDARDQLKAESEEMKKPAQGLRQLKGVGRDGCICEGGN